MEHLQTVVMRCRPLPGVRHQAILKRAKVQASQNLILTAVQIAVEKVIRATEVSRHFTVFQTIVAQNLDWSRHQCQLLASRLIASVCVPRLISAILMPFAMHCVPKQWDVIVTASAARVTQFVAMVVTTVVTLSMDVNLVVRSEKTSS